MYRGMFEIQTSGNMTSSVENCLTIRINASLKKGSGVRRSKRPVSMYFGDIPTFGNRVKVGNKVTNWCNVWWIAGVAVYCHLECLVIFGRGLHYIWSEKKEEIWLSPMTKAPTPTEMSKGQNNNTNNATKSSITERLRTDLGWSVGVTMATQLVWLTWFTDPTFPLPATAV